ncbi:MAG: hypothetical protein ACTS5A_03280 [Candidatus Hodgkinia cicadicola]
MGIERPNVRKLMNGFATFVSSFGVNSAKRLALLTKVVAFISAGWGVFYLRRAERNESEGGENPLQTVAGTVELIPLRSERSLVEREVKRLPKLF